MANRPVLLTIQLSTEHETYYFLRKNLYINHKLRTFALARINFAKIF